MANLTSDDIGKIVSFTVYPSSIIGTLFEKVTVLAILDAESAFQFIDPISLHANVYPTLPLGTPNNYRSYAYAKVKLLDGQVTCVGLPWINEASIEIHTNTTFRFTINNRPAGDYQRVRNLLLLNGFDDIFGEFL